MSLSPTTYLQLHATPQILLKKNFALIGVKFITNLACSILAVEYRSQLSSISPFLESFSLSLASDRLSSLAFNILWPEASKQIRLVEKYNSSSQPIFGDTQIVERFALSFIKHALTPQIKKGESILGAHANALLTQSLFCGILYSLHIYFFHCKSKALIKDIQQKSNQILNQLNMPASSNQDFLTFTEELHHSYKTLDPQFLEEFNRYISDHIDKTLQNALSNASTKDLNAYIHYAFSLNPKAAKDTLNAFVYYDQDSEILESNLKFLEQSLSDNDIISALKLQMPSSISQKLPAINKGDDEQHKWSKMLLFLYKTSEDKALKQEIYEGFAKRLQHLSFCEDDQKKLISYFQHMPYMLDDTDDRAIIVDGIIAPICDEIDKDRLFKSFIKIAKEKISDCIDHKAEIIQFFKHSLCPPTKIEDFDQAFIAYTLEVLQQVERDRDYSRQEDYKSYLELLKQISENDYKEYCQNLESKPLLSIMNEGSIEGEYDPIACSRWFKEEITPISGLEQLQMVAFLSIGSVSLQYIISKVLKDFLSHEFKHLVDHPINQLFIRYIGVQAIPILCLPQAAVLSPALNKLQLSRIRQLKISRINHYEKKEELLLSRKAQYDLIDFSDRVLSQVMLSQFLSPLLFNLGNFFIFEGKEMPVAKFTMYFLLPSIFYISSYLSANEKLPDYIQGCMKEEMQNLYSNMESQAQELFPEDYVVVQKRTTFSRILDGIFGKQLEQVMNKHSPFTLDILLERGNSKLIDKIESLSKKENLSSFEYFQLAYLFSKLDYEQSSQAIKYLLESPQKREKFHAINKDFRFWVKRIHNEDKETLKLFIQEFPDFHKELELVLLEFKTKENIDNDYQKWQSFFNQVQQNV